MEAHNDGKKNISYIESQRGLQTQSELHLTGQMRFRSFTYV